MLTDAHYAPPPEPPFNLEGIVPDEKLLPVGVHFGLDENLYHASFGLSYSGIKHLRVSAYDWWVRSPLNPNLAEVLEEEGSTLAKDMGKAFDARIVCGKAYFDAHYALEIGKADYPDALDTMDDMKTWLENRELPKTAKTKAALIARILEADPRAQIWDAIQDGYYKQHEGKEFLPAKLMHKIEIAAAMIEKHPQLSKAFSGGAAQVSVIWDCPKIGVRCRARFDYLRPRMIADLKTYQDLQGKPLESAIGREIGFRGYHLQAAHYLEAASHIAGFIKTGRVFGDADKSFLGALAANHEKTWLWVLQRKGVAPIASGRVLPKESSLLAIAQAECENAKQTFRLNLEKYGALPWVQAEEIMPLDDAQVPAWSISQ